MFASIVLLMATATKKKRKEEAYPWKAGASSGHKTNLRQSILETFNIYAQNQLRDCPIIKLARDVNLQRQNINRFWLVF